MNYRSKQKHLVRLQVIGFLALFLASYLATGVLVLFLKPAPLANALGFLALLGYAATILPSVLRVVFPATKGNPILKWLLKYRRQMGVAAFGFGANHGVLLIVERQLDLLDWHTYMEYCQGFAMLGIFTVLALTSNDESVKRLKKNWKKLHRLTYLVIFLLPWHILDKMSLHWSYLTPFAVAIALVLLILFVRRQWLE